MRLYSTVTSERASKGQGGNEFLEVEFSIDNGNIILGEIYLDIKNDIEENSCDMNEWYIQWKPNGAEDAQIIAQGHYVPKTKGEKQKTAKCVCGNMVSDKDARLCDHCYYNQPHL